MEEWRQARGWCSTGQGKNTSEKNQGARAVIETKLQAWHLVSFCSATYTCFAYANLSLVEIACPDALPEIVQSFRVAQINDLSSIFVVKIA